MEKRIKKQINIGRLVGLLRTGMLPESEEKRLHAWVKENEANQRLFNRLLDEKIDESSRNIEPSIAWQDFVKRYKINTRNKRQINWITYAAIACCASIFIYAGVFLFSRDEPTREIQQPRLSHEVQLVLDNGRSIPLKGKTQEKLQAETGIHLGLQEEQLDYTLNTNQTQEKTMEYHTIVVPKYGEYTVLLADGSTVLLNSESKLRYPVNFSDNCREVWLEGEGYFQVNRDTTKSFVVHAGGCEVKVLGTTFNLKNTPETQLTETTLVSGKVEVGFGEESRILHPGQQASTRNGGKEITVKQVNTRAATAWTRNMFYFDEQPLEYIMEELTRWYEFEVVFTREELRQRQFTLEASRYEHIDQILRLIEETHVVTCRKEGKIIYIE